MENTKHVIIADPFPQTLERIFAEETWNRLTSIARVESPEGEHMDPDRFDALLSEAVAVIGQSPMPKERLDKAPNSRGIFTRISIMRNASVGISGCSIVARSTPARLRKWPSGWLSTWPVASHGSICASVTEQNDMSWKVTKKHNCSLVHVLD